MNRTNGNNSQYLSQFKTSTAIGWKKAGWTWIDIVFGYNFDTNAKIHFDNWKEKRNSKTEFEF